jgi:hypothetical protein
VWDLQSRIGRHDAVNFASDPTEPFGNFEFAAALRHQLHADTDAKERPALSAHTRVKRINHTGNRIQAVAAIREGADAGKHDPVRAYHHIGVAGHHDRLIVPGFPRRTFEGFRSGMQIA